MTHLVHVWLWLASIAVSPPDSTLPIALRTAAADSGDINHSLDSALIHAGEALARGRPWQATRLIAPWLNDSSRRTPGAVFLAARAASEWRGWSEVLQLLGSEPWVDTLYGGNARVLLARAALERRQDSIALYHATLALGRRPGSGERLLLLATALDRLGARDSAASVYLRAAEQLPSVADWLLLRSAAVTDDSVARVALYGRLTNPLAQSRIPRTDAAAHEKIGDLLGAARRYAAAGDRITSLRLRLAASPDSRPRAELRREFLGLVTGRAGGAAVREAIIVLDSVFAPLKPAEELVVARAAMEAGWAARAASGFAKVGGGALGSGEDRFTYGNALTRLNRNAEAALQFELVREPRSMAALAAYLAARALVRDGQIEPGRAALVAVSLKHERDTVAAASALFLRADLASDDRGDLEARRLHRIVALRYPTSRFAPTSRFRAAMIALLSGQPRLAAEEFDALVERHPGSDEVLSATYWAGRSWADAGDSSLARGRWQSVTARDPLSYYAALSSRRLGIRPWVPRPAPDSFATDTALETKVARAALLARLGLVAESRWELDRLARSSDSSPEHLLTLANAFRTQGMASQAIQIARRALALGAPPDARTYRLIYPVVHEDALSAEAAEHRLDPSLMAALIRQESNFNPSATSPAGARGLAQVMPELGERLARELEYPVWDPVLLYQPDVSIQLGAVHLRELFTRYEDRVHILAAYNAGVSRVERWSQRIGVDDPEVFAERIAFVETRDYVRIIQRNEDIYRALYRGQLTERAKSPPSSLEEPVAGDIPQM
ncbi:MAG: transglycosylase SLT domain-containing protein [Gemmatimonadales bacterium]|nr:transglycosylase SLT domain-containing protein [Gemmatimonadales bacterium]